MLYFVVAAAVVIIDQASKRLVWAAFEDTGGTELLEYDLLRSPTATDFDVLGVCALSDGIDQFADDPAEPAAGEALHWLVRAENDCGGTLGDGEAGERPGRVCP